ncbi:hypothetical protein ACF1A4_14305 [Streptomyces albidoflavus]|uniref:hypothetical protein n=1 Tax=Streptomyces sp. BV333 TaxID=2849673 RepID=UPI001C2EB3A3|nr:hypothetical protein [Streptomyces sp. BV333]MBV1955953.1 hypothetical protein [Streptomyces sp. BV333]
MDVVGQAITILAVVVGALTTHFTNHLLERQRMRHLLLTRWDERKLETYAEYIDAVRTCIYSAVMLYEARTGLSRSERSETSLAEELTEAEGVRSRAFERVMLLAEDQVIEAAHGINTATKAIDWRARGTTEGPLEEWRELNREAFRAINRFHENARADLGVLGAFQGADHSARALILPESRREGQATADGE